MRLYFAELDQLDQRRVAHARTQHPLVTGLRKARNASVARLDPAPWRSIPTPEARAANPDAHGHPARVDDALLAEALLAIPASRAKNHTPLRIMHVIGSLSAGGAERQAVYLARESCRRGLSASITLLNPLAGAASHYLPLAQEAGVTVRVAGEKADPIALRTLAKDARLARVLGAIDTQYRAWCADLAGEFLATHPDVVHSWLDHANVWAGIAALATGVKRIVLSTRNVNPTHFPSLQIPGCLEWYRAFARSPRVTFIANSRAGAEDYARWIGIDPSRFHIVLNGIDPSAMTPCSKSTTDRTRAALGIDNARIVLGVFRLAEEKQPLVWAEAAMQLLRAEKDIIILQAGDGPLREEFAAAMRDAPEGRFRMLGVRDDIGALMAASDMLLHASRKEGTPNALIEAQSLGCPVIATRGGGTVDAVDDGASGLLSDVGDAHALVQNALRVLRDPALHAAMRAHARQFAAKKFGLDRMVNESLTACAINTQEASRR